MAPNAAEDRSAMSFPELVSWAWRETPPLHKNGANLLIHIVAVPLFVLGHVLLVVGILINPWLLVYAEQFCNFWRFLFSGRWYASFQANRSGA